MLDKYKELNDNSKNYFINQLKRISISNENMNRCLNEIELLYDKGILFILEYMHKYKNDSKDISFHFHGTINNLLVLFVLKISYVDPIKYCLPYELFTDETINFDIINDINSSFISYFEMASGAVRLIYGYNGKDEELEINELEDNHYLVIPVWCDEKNLLFRLDSIHGFETADDYRKYKDEYIIIKIGEKPLYINEKCDIKSALGDDFMKSLISKLYPNTIKDYSKIIELSHGTNVWNNNQDILYNQQKIDIHNIISSREDVYEYLIAHSIDKSSALEIINYISMPYKDTSKWDKYNKIMTKHQCEYMYINIFSKIHYLTGRGEAISECLYALGENNYIDVNMKTN